MRRATAAIRGVAVLCLWLAGSARADTWWDVNSTGLYGPGDFAIDNAGRATYAHRTTEYPYAMNYAVRESGAWSDETVAGSHSVGTWPPDLAYAPSGEPGIAHAYWVGDATARYTYRSGGVWHTERVSPGEGQYFSLAYAPNQHACMAYLNTDSPSGTGWTIDYAERTGVDSWNVETVATARYSAWGHETGLAFLPDTGEPAISFLYGFDTSDPPHLRTAELRYAYRNSGTWHVEHVDSSSDFVGHYNDMALDPQGNPAISYYDPTNDQLKLARRIGSDNWLTEIVDTDGDVGRFNSLAFLTDGRPTIAYTDMTNHDLNYAVWNDGGWDIDCVAEGLYGYYCKLVIDANDQPSIMFTDSDYLVYQATLVPEPAALVLTVLGASLLRRRSARTVRITTPEPA